MTHPQKVELYEQMQGRGKEVSSYPAAELDRSFFVGLAYLFAVVVMALAIGIFGYRYVGPIGTVLGIVAGDRLLLRPVVRFLMGKRGK